MKGASEMRRELRRRGHTFVYAIQAGEGGPVKIGIAKHPHERLLTLQTASPIRLRGIAVWWGSSEEEKMWHEVFKDQRLEGEWFKPTEELLALMDFMGGPPHCEFHREGDCLAAGPAWPLNGTCKACDVQFFGDEAIDLEHRLSTERGGA